MYRRSRSQLVAAALTLILAMLVLPLPWEEGAHAAKQRTWPERELVELRSAKAKTFRQPNGSLVTKLSQQSLHYFDRTKEKWNDIDASFKDSQKQGKKWESGANRFSVELAEETDAGFLTFASPDGSVAVSFEDAGKVRGVKADENAITFKDALKDVDVEYVVLPDGLKETIVLRKAGAPSEYRFRLTPAPGDSFTTEEREDGSVWFFGEGSSEPAFTLLPPVVGDSADQALPQPDVAVKSPPSWSAAPGKASMEVEEDDGTFVVTLKIDAEWLADASRVYPIVLDPTWYVTPDQADGEYDTTNGGNPNVTATEIRTGRNGSGGAKYASVLNFDVATIPPGAKVLDARLNAYLNACFPTTCASGHTGDVELRRLTSGWDASTPWSAVTKDSTLLDKVSFTTTPVANWYRWSSGAFTQTVQSFVNGTYASYGLILEKNAGNDTIGYKWRSSRWTDPSSAPYLEVFWVADGVQVDPASKVHSNGAELVWQHYAGGGTSAYADAIFSDSPVAYYRLDEGYGDTTAWDWSGSDVVATIQTPTGAVRAEPGALADGDTSTKLLGSPAGYVKVPDDPVIRVNDTFTLEAWVRRLDLTARDMAIFNDFGSGFWLRINTANKLQLLANSGGASIVQSTTTIADTNWHHVAATKSGSSVKLYIDGVDRTATVTNQTLASSTSGFHIGLTDGGSQPFYGWIDEATLYPTALSSTRVSAHYSAATTPMPGFQRFEVHRSGTANFTPSASTLVGTVVDSAVQTFRDTSAKAGSTFYYETVTVTDEGSFSSNEVKAVLPAAGEAQVTIQPGYISTSAAGTHVSSGSPNTPNGNSQSLVVGSSGTNHTRTLIAFDMRAIPTGVDITSAQLQLYALGTTPAVNAHRISSSWLEGGATWNARDNNTEPDTLWTTAGGDFDSSAAASSAGGSNLHWDTWELGSLVDEWVAGQKSHFGVLLKYGSENGSQSTLSFAADGYVRAIALRPKLVVSYQDGSAAVAPTVAVSQPQAGASVKGTTTVKAGALDDGRVTDVEFFLDGTTSLGTDTTAPYEVSWNTTSASRGNHTLTAKATDEAGNLQTSQAVTVTVANSASPTTSITSATGGGGGVWTVNASASDDIQVAKVEFYVDGDRFAADTSSPYSATLPTLTLPVYDGAHTLTTVAYDEDGNTTTSAGNPITVANTSGTKYQGTIAVANMPLELTYDPAGGTQDAAKVAVTLTNNSSVTWLNSQIKYRYSWYTADSPPTVWSSTSGGIGGDLAPAGQRNFNPLIDPPTLPTGVYRARYKLRFDLYDNTVPAYFADKGNKPFEAWVTVTREVPDELGLERYQQFDGEDLGGGFDHALNLANGNNVVQWVPFSQPGRGINTVVTMTYNSLEHGSVSTLGNSWSLAISSLTPFGLPLDVHPNASDTAAGRTQKWVGFTDADGSYHVFTGNTAGTYYTAPPGVRLYLKALGGGGWELWKPDRTKFVFDAAGFPTSVADADGNALTYTLATPGAGEDAYGLAKRVTTVTDAGGRDFTLTYFSKAETPTPAMRGKLKKLVDHVGHALEFTYYEDGNLRSIREKGGPGDDGMPTPDREVVFTYTTPDGTGPAITPFSARQNPDPATVQSPKLFSVIDFRGNETTFAYSTAADAKKWRITARTNRTSNQTTFSYDTTARTTTATMPLSRVWTYSFDTEGRVTQIDDPVNTSHTQIEWADSTAPNEVTNTVRKVTQPTGEYVEYAYNANGYKTDEWDELRNHQTFEYENIAVDANDASGNWEAGRSIAHISQLTAVVKPVGNATTGNPDDYRWEFAYTSTGLVDTITDPLGNVTDNSWNANGTLASQTLPANGDGITRTTTFNTHDANGLATNVTDAAGGTAQAGYAANGNLVWEQDPNHSSYTGGTPAEYRTEYSYDAFGRLFRLSQPKSTAYTPGLLVWKAMAYDPNDNDVQTIASHHGRGDGGSGAVTTTTYDAMDRETLVTGPRTAAQGGPVKLKTEYDAAGRVTRVTDPKGVDSAPADDYVTETMYDLVDRELTVTAYATESGATRVTNYCYDDAGDLRSVTGPKGASTFTSCPSLTAEPYVYTTATHTTKLIYDDAHRPIKTIDALGNDTETAYDENGAVTSATDEADKVTQTFFDDRGMQTKIVEPFDTGRTLTTISEYDALGNVKRLISPRAFDAAGGQAPYADYVESYSYDELSRRVTTTLPTAGNRYAAVVKDPTPSQGPYAYWRLGEASGTTMNDASGNGRNGTYVNSPTLGVASPMPGDADTAMTVPTGGVYTATASGISLANQSFSLSFWMKRATTGTTDYALGHGSASTNNGLYAGFRSTNAFTFSFYGNDLNTTATYTDTAWHHWALTYDSGTNARKIYRDGVEVASATASADYQGSGTFTLGSTPWNSSGDSMGGGSLDEVGVWTRVLAPAEVQQQYGVGITGATPAAYRHQAYDANSQTLWTSLATTAATPGTVTPQEKTQLAYWDTGSIYSTQDPANPKVRFDYTAEGWQASRIPEQVGKAGFLDFGRAMYWDYLPDGLLRALLDQGGERALYAYDANSNKTLATEATGLVNPGQTPLTIDLSYNSLDELSNVRTPKPGASGTYLATVMSYDLHGNTVGLTDNREEDGSGSQTAPGRVFAYTYNAIDKAIAQTDDFSTSGPTDDEQILYTYKLTGELDTQTLQKGGSGSWVNEQSSERTYFENGLLKTLVNKNGAGTLIQSHTQSYLQSGVYQNGNRVSDVFVLKGPDATAACYTSACTQSWVYDARERVTHANPGTGAATLFALDVHGNVTQEVNGTATTTRAYSGQQLQTEDFSSGTDRRYLYDSLGSVDCVVKLAYSGASCPAAGDANLLEDNIYDYKSRLAGFRAYNGSGTLTMRTDYTNDPLDRPVAQVETASGQTTNFAFTYVGVTNALSKEVLTGATSTTKRYAYDAFGKRTTITEGSNRYSYLYDPLGSVSLLIDQSNAVKESYGYATYGASNAALQKSASGFNNQSVPKNPYRYTGKRLDSGSGTYDMGARRYSAQIGRFLQYDAFYNALASFMIPSDPLVENRYALAGGNPINAVETDGHSSALLVERAQIAGRALVHGSALNARSSFLALSTRSSACATNPQLIAIAKKRGGGGGGSQSSKPLSGTGDCRQQSLIACATSCAAVWCTSPVVPCLPLLTIEPIGVGLFLECVGVFCGPAIGTCISRCSKRESKNCAGGGGGGGFPEATDPPGSEGKGGPTTGYGGKGSGGGGGGFGGGDDSKDKKPTKRTGGGGGRYLVM